MKRDLAELIRKAGEAVNAMTPDEKRKMIDAQRKSWVIGELMLSNLEVTRETAEQIYKASQ